MSKKLKHIEEGQVEKRQKTKNLNKRNNAERQEMERKWGAWVLNPPIFNPFQLRRRKAESGHTIIIRLAEDMTRENIQKRLDAAFGDLNGTSKKPL